MPRVRIAYCHGVRDARMGLGCLPPFYAHSETVTYRRGYAIERLRIVKGREK